MKSLNTVIFDMEDTMYPRRQYIRSGCRAVSKYMSRIFGTDCARDLEDACNSAGISTAITMTVAKHFNHVDSALISRLVHVWRCHKPAISLHQDARVALAILRNMSMQLGIISNDLPEVQANKMAALELRDQIDSACYGRDDDGLDTMESALRLIELLCGTSLENIVFVGSTESDFSTPRNLGIATVCINREARPPAAGTGRHKGTADVTIDSMIDLHCSIAQLDESRTRRSA